MKSNSRKKIQSLSKQLIFFLIENSIILMESKIGKSFLECSFISLMTYLGSNAKWFEKLEWIYWGLRTRRTFCKKPFLTHIVPDHKGY